MRLAVYTDYAYRRAGGVVYAERAFALFVAALAEQLDEIVLVGRLEPSAGEGRYRLPPEITFVALPHHRGLATQPAATAWALVRSLRRVWSALDRADAIWLLGPHPLLVPSAVMAAARGRPVALGIRQDSRRYIRSRHPGRRVAWLAADMLEAVTIALARRCPTVVVGPDIARRYRRARRLLEIFISLVRDVDLVAPEEALARPFGDELEVLSVGRLEQEKNPLLLADVTERLARSGRRWRLTVCGDGPMSEAVRARADALGVGDRLELAGYVALGPALLARYRASHALLHVSWTEGVPQVLFEAFAAGVPVVATAVGGIPEAVDGAALLVAPGDADAAAAALERLAADPALRSELVRRGHAIARAHTLDSETARVAAFFNAELQRRR
jgi:glycosyltransferase involved in cell wall biosynthesis